MKILNEMTGEISKIYISGLSKWWYFTITAEQSPI